MQASFFNQKKQESEFVLLFRKCSLLEIASTIINMRAGGVGDFRVRQMQSSDEMVQANNESAKTDELGYNRRYLDRYLTRNLYEFSLTQTVELIAWQTNLVVIAKKSSCRQGSEGVLIIAGQQLYGAAFIEDEQAVCTLLDKFYKLNGKQQQKLQWISSAFARLLANASSLNPKLEKFQQFQDGDEFLQLQQPLTNNETEQKVRQNPDDSYLICTPEQYGAYTENPYVTAEEKKRINSIISDMYTALENLLKNQSNGIIIQIFISEEDLSNSVSNDSSRISCVHQEMPIEQQDNTKIFFTRSSDSSTKEISEQPPIAQLNKRQINVPEQRFKISVIPLITEGIRIDLKQFATKCYEFLPLIIPKNSNLIKKMQEVFAISTTTEQSLAELPSVVHLE